MAERLLAESLASAPEAASHITRGVQILEQVGAQNEVAKALIVLARLRRTVDDIDEARSLLKQAIKIFERLGTIDGPGAARASLAAL